MWNLERIYCFLIYFVAYKHIRDILEALFVRMCRI